MKMKTILMSSLALITYSLNAQIDASLESVVLNRYNIINSSNQLSLNVKNNGNSAISSLTVNWNDGTNHSQLISASIAAGASATVNHPTMVSYNSIVEKNITVTIVNVNNASDPVTSNNSKTIAFNTVSEVPHKNVVLEEATGTWCINCPGGVYYIEDVIMPQVPNNFIPISIHHGGNDPMEISNYFSYTGLVAYPTGNLNRKIKDVTAGNGWGDGFNILIDQVAPALIEATVTNNGQNVTINTSTNFYTNFSSANFRLAAVITEDHVTGTTSGYNQANTYSGNANVPFFGSQPNPVPASQMVYNYVARALLNDAYNGMAGSIPTTISDGTIVDYTFNYTVPSESNIDSMYAVIMLIDQTTGEIVNSSKFPIKAISTSNAGIDKTDLMRLTIYPNPAVDLMTISFEGNDSEHTIKVLDLTGKMIYTKTIAGINGVQNFQFPVSTIDAGTYLLSVESEGKKTIEQIIIK